MTPAEAAPILGLAEHSVREAIRTQSLPATKGPFGRWELNPEDVEKYRAQAERARATAAKVAAKAAKREKPKPRQQPTRQKAPGAPTKAQQLAGILAQMAELAAQAETIAANMMPAQAEYAGRLLWDRMDDNHRALHIAFVDTQVKLRKRATG